MENQKRGWGRGSSSSGHWHGPQSPSKATSAGKHTVTLPSLCWTPPMSILVKIKLETSKCHIPLSSSHWQNSTWLQQPGV